MPQRRLLQTTGVWLLAASVELVLGLSLMTPMQAQVAHPDTSAPATTVEGTVRFKPPNRGLPRNIVGCTIRVHTCSTEKTPLTVLVPSIQSNTFGLTTDSHPTFFVYLPKPLAQSAEFTLRDTEDREVYRTTMPLAGHSGLVSVQLPADAPALEVGQFYQWYFSVICQPRDRLQDNFVSAWVQRMQPDQALAIKLGAATARKRPGIYAEAGIWQDTLTTLAALRRANPADPTLLNDWNRLLESVGFGQIVNAAGDAPVTQLTVKTESPLFSDPYD